MTAVQRNFSGGEISPDLYGRVDQVRYATGLRTARNFMVMRHGGVANRPGTVFVGEVKDSTKTVRLTSFVFNSDQAYLLEFGDLYMRVVRNGAQVTDLTLTITGITNANPAVVTYTGTDPSNGDEVYISSITGAIGTYLNGRNFKIASVDAGGNTFQLQYMSGTNVNSTSMGAYTSGGTAARIYTLTTPYLEADLPQLQFVQSADVVTIVHPTYAPRELSRSGHSSWTLSTVTFAPNISRPTSCAATAGAAGSNTYRYRITAIEDETLEESLPGLAATVNITGITKANPAVVTANSHGYANGDEVFITGVGGMTEVNDLTFTVANQTANTFELSGVNSSSYTTYTSGGTVARTCAKVTSAAAPTSTAANSVSWTAVSGAIEYNVYRELNGVYGYIGVARGTSFSDTGITPDTTDTPPEVLARNPFDSASNYPSAVTYFQQRLCFANTDNDPEKVWTTMVGHYKNLNVQAPLLEDVAVTFTLAGREVNEIRHMIDLDSLVLFTTGGVWVVSGDSAGILTPSEINAKQHSYEGSSILRPLLIGNTALYVQSRVQTFGSIVRDLRFAFDSDSYTGTDLTIFSPHLFDSYTLRDWAYQPMPHCVVWVVRSDGTLLGLTYVRDHEIAGWHRHDFDGTVENVCVVPESTEDRLYLLIKRTINGRTVRYIEEMASRTIDEDAVEDLIFMDCELAYDGWHTGSTTMTLSGGTNWTYTETLTLTASASTFASTDVGNEIHLEGTDGTLIRFTIVEYTSATVVTGHPHMTVPSAMRSVAIATWADAVDEVTGMWHLEGETVSILADGFVVASPNNESYTTRTVTNGTVTLDKCYAVVRIGLPITADLETLDLDVPQGTIADMKKLVQKVLLRVHQSRGAWVGVAAPSDDTVDPLEGLTEIKARVDEDYSAPIVLTTGSMEVNVQGEWSSNGRVFVRQVDPVPLTVLAISPAGYIPR